MESRRRHVRNGRVIEFILEPGDKSLVRRRVGPLISNRRHHSCTELLDDLFPLFAVLPHVRNIQSLKRQAPKMGGLAMAFHAVVIDNFLLLQGCRCRGRRGLGRRPGCRSGGCCRLWRCRLPVNHENKGQCCEDSHAQPQESLLHESLRFTIILSIPVKCFGMR